MVRFMGHMKYIAEKQPGQATAASTGMVYNLTAYLLGLYIFLNPFPATSPKEIIFYSSALVFVFLVFTRRGLIAYRVPLTIPFAILRAGAF